LIKMPPLSPLLLLATSSTRGEICGGPVSLLPMLVPHPSDCAAFFTCLAATTKDGARRWAPVLGKCPSGTRFTGTHCEQMLPCQPEARQPRWCELPPFSFCASWRQTEKEEETGCCLSSKLESQQTSQAEASKPNTDHKQVEPEIEPESEPETEQTLADEVAHAKGETSSALAQKAEMDDMTTVKSISSQATEGSNIIEDTEEKLETNLRPHRNLKNFKISVEMSEENKVVFKVPKEEEEDIAQEINEVFNTLPEKDEILLEINEDKTEANVNSLTVKNLQDLEALVVQKVKNIVLMQKAPQSRRLR